MSGSVSRRKQWIAAALAVAVLALLAVDHKLRADRCTAAKGRWHAVAYRCEIAPPGILLQRDLLRT